MPKTKLRATAKPFVFGVKKKNNGDQQAAQEAQRKQEAERKAAEETKRQEAERQRKLREEEERRKQEEERRKQEEEERKRREEEEAEKKAEEEKRIAEEKRAEEERLRQEEERKKEEEKKKMTTGCKYTREFLLAFQQRFTDAPAGLSSKFLKGQGNNRRGGHGNRGGGNYRDRRNDNYNNNRRQGGHGHGGRNNRNDRRRGGGRRGPKPDAPMDIEIKALEKTDNRYTIKKDVPPDQKLLREINLLLNKLTPEKFDKLSKQFFDLGIDTVHKLRDVVKAVFEKSLAEPNFCPTYAELCKVLHKGLPAFETEQQGSTQNFKRLLLNQCQKEFEKDGAIDLAKADELETQEEKDSYLLKAKQRRLGTTRFIGELFLRGLIAMRIVSVCFQYLICDPAHPDEQNIETLCKLLNTIGETLSKRERKVPMNQRMGVKTLGAMKSMIDNQLITQSRVRFMVMDTLELAQNGWVQRLQKETAKKLSEIHKEETQKKDRDRENERRRIKEDKRRHFENRFLPQARPPVNKTYHSNRRRDKRQNQDADGWENTPRVNKGGGRNNRSGDVRLEQKKGGQRKKYNRRQKSKSPKPPPQRKSMFEMLDMDNEEDEDSAPEEVQSPMSEPEAKLSEAERDAVVKKIKALTREYFTAVDVKEAKLCVEELGTSQLNHALVFEGMMLSFDKREREQKLLRDLFRFFVTNNILSRGQIEMGFNEMMEWGNDIAPDFPLMFDILGKHLAAFIVHTPATIGLGYLFSEPTAQLDAKRYRPKFVLGTLKELKVSKGEKGLQAMTASVDGFAASVAAAGVTNEMLTQAGLQCLV